MNTLRILKLGWKGGLIGLTTMVLAVSGLFMSLQKASAGAPNLTVSHLGNNASAPTTYTHNVTLTSGQYVALYSEIHNTNVPSTANNVRVRVSLPSGSGSSVATVSADNASSVSDAVNIQIPNGTTLQYVSGSTHMTWDQNGDETNEFDNTVMPDGIANGGLPLGNQSGCNAYIIQITFMARVVAVTPSPTPTPSVTPSPTPTPSVTPSPTPTPTATPSATPSPTPVVTPSPTPVVTPSPTPSPVGGITIENTNNNNNTNNNTNNNNINITGSTAATTTVASVPLKQPETGAGVAGIATMFGAAPLGVVMSKYGKGRLFAKKQEEDTLSEIASGLVNSRSSKQA